MNWQPIETAPTDGTVVLGLGLPAWSGSRENDWPAVREMRAWKIGDSVGWNMRNEFSGFTVGFVPTRWVPMPDPSSSSCMSAEIVTGHQHCIKIDHDALRLYRADPLLLEALKEAERTLQGFWLNCTFDDDTQDGEVARNLLVRIRSAIAAATRSET